METSDDNVSFNRPPSAADPMTGPPLLPPPDVGQQPPPFVPRGDAPTATVMPSESPRRRSPGKVVGSAVAVVALLGAGGFAVSRIVGGSDGGAATPTEVGNRLVEALSAEDALGVVDLLLPGERETMRQPLIDLVDNLKRLEIADTSASLDKIAGLDISFENVKVEPSATNVDDITNIRVTATSTSMVDGEAVPIGKLLIDEAFDGTRPEVDGAPQAEIVDWKMATVQRDGRWYLSAFYSIAESIRTEDGADIPDASLVARGADTPEGAVQAMFDAVDDLDLEALLAVLNPNEAEALQRYAPMFIDEAQRPLDDSGATVDFTDTKFTVTGDGDRRTVAVDAFTMNASSDGEDVTVKGKGGCVVMTAPENTTDTCEGDKSIDSALSVLGVDENQDVKGLATAVRDAFADMKPIGLTVQRVNGQWFVSPVGTFADVMLAVLGALDKNELTDIIHRFTTVVESATAGEIVLPGVGSVGGADIEFSGLDSCYSESDYGAFSDCLAASASDGSIDMTVVPAYYRFDECGVGESYWSGDVYGMSDEEFTAFANESAPCFQALVADGVISEYELPYELYRPECLEGKNFYSSIDEAYSTRVFECVS